MSVPARNPAPSDGALRGEILGSTMPEVFADLEARRVTGTLVAATGSVRRTAQLRDGRIQFAASTDRDDRFNQVLIKAGVIKLKDLLRALEIALATRDRLGEVLIKMKMVEPGDVEKWVRAQVRGILFNMIEQTSGQWSFEPGPVPVETIRLDLPAGIAAFEGVRKVSSWSRVYEQVGGLNAEYLATNDAETVAATLPLFPGERALLTMCRTPTSLGEMCEASQMGDFQVCRSIWGLLLVSALMKA
ncbi:MAG TPA: DUF4388 domain-containing protein [Candidatus Polarisedimenticolia bacterium]|nr:DUF4388 domain-containing protein [Candidatus Polarisedimenticolia bacterium]